MRQSVYENRDKTISMINDLPKDSSSERRYA